MLCKCTTNKGERKPPRTQFLNVTVDQRLRSEKKMLRTVSLVVFKIVDNSL